MYFYFITKKGMLMMNKKKFSVFYQLLRTVTKKKY